MRTMAFSKVYSFSAPPEVVFNTLTDPDRAASWLPSGMSLQRQDGDRLVLRADDRAWQLRLSTDDEHMHIDGRAVDSSGLEGSLHVSQGPAGGSTMRVEVGTADATRLEALVDDAIERLSRDVGDNFNAG